MEGVKSNTDISETPSWPIDLDCILKKLDSMLECMNNLAVETQLLQCNLTVSFNHPVKMADVDIGMDEAEWSSATTTSEQ